MNGPFALPPDLGPPRDPLDDDVRFDRPVPPNGYAWWYVDAISETGDDALTMILFVGSVFSPYYAFSGRHAPENHCALNVALYRRQGSRWTMTERPAHDVDRQAGSFQIGPSRVDRTANGYSISVSEYGAPLPRPMVGTITVEFEARTTRCFRLDPLGRHCWWPVSPIARVTVDFEQPKLRWQGRGYTDMNRGTEPLEAGFHYWDWARTDLNADQTHIRYVSDHVSGDHGRLGLTIDRSGRIDLVDLEPTHALSHTSIWQIPRRAGVLQDRAPQLVRTLEDTPFYSRSMTAYRHETGDMLHGVHESFSGKRLRSPLIKALLPVRMPRRRFRET